MEKRQMGGFAVVGCDAGDATRRNGADLLAGVPVPRCLSLVQPHRVLGGDERFREGSQVGIGCRGGIAGATEERG